MSWPSKLWTAILWVRFADGLEGEVDMAQRAHSPCAGVFAALADPDICVQAYVELGAVTSPVSLTSRRDAMHDEIEKNRIWILK